MKELIEKVRIALEASDKAYDAWESDLENEQLENYFDVAYQTYHNTAKELAKEINGLAGIDFTTAYKMALTKLDELEALVNRAAQ